MKRGAAFAAGLAVALIGSLGIAPAMATTIDFNSVPSVGNPVQTSITVQGFVFSSPHFHTIDSSAGCLFGGCTAGDGSIYLSVDGPTLGQPIVMTAEGGGTFSLVSADLAQLWLDSGDASANGFANATLIAMIGSNGHVVSLANPTTNFLTLDAGGLLDNVTSVTFEGFGPLNIETNWSFALDNVVVDVATVPEPSALLLLSTALLSLGLGIGVTGRTRKRF